jgi:hypothetical protein
LMHVDTQRMPFRHRPRKYQLKITPILQEYYKNGLTTVDGVAPQVRVGLARL